MSLALSVLDLVPVSSGSSAPEALRHSLALARQVEEWGYTRYWLAEHHNMPGIASSAPEILIGQVARETTRLRVGSGGIMLPNHAPLHVAESFLTLEALFPGRIDLGIGRAPGTDPRTALALRRDDSAGRDDTPQQLDDLFAFAGRRFPEDHPFYRVGAIPTQVALPPVWLLGSSDWGARQAAARGLGFVFAHHINPVGALEAMRLYHDLFQPSDELAAPRAILTVSAVCADTNEAADDLATSMDLAWLRLHSGRPAPFPSPAEAKAYPYSYPERAQVQATRTRMIVGDAIRVRDQICRLAEQTGVDEVMVTTIVHDPQARLRSYELLSEAFALPRDGGAQILS